MMGLLGGWSIFIAKGIPIPARIEQGLEEFRDQLDLWREFEYDLGRMPPSVKRSLCEVVHRVRRLIDEFFAQRGSRENLS